jgi:hypothetical protein
MHMEMYYRGALIRPIVYRAKGVFHSSVVIRDADGNQQLFESIGRFASDRAAAYFAVDWAIARLNGEELEPPFRMLDA